MLHLITTLITIVLVLFAILICVYGLLCMITHCHAIFKDSEGTISERVFIILCITYFLGMTMLGFVKIISLILSL